MEKDIEQENEIENSIKEIKDQIVTLEQIISDLDEREPQITREESYYRKEIRTNGSSIRDYNHISSLSKSQKGMNDSDEKSKFLSAIMIVILLVIINLLIHLLFAIVWLNEGSWEIDKLLAILLITFAGGCTGINWIYKNLLSKYQY